MTNVIENERWRPADRAADFLSADREVCRRAFHQEHEERVREIVEWVLSEGSLPGNDPERMIERWAVSMAPASIERILSAMAWSRWRVS